MKVDIPRRCRLTFEGHGSFYYPRRCIHVGFDCRCVQGVCVHTYRHVSIYAAHFTVRLTRSLSLFGQESRTFFLLCFMRKKVLYFFVKGISTKGGDGSFTESCKVMANFA